MQKYAASVVLLLLLVVTCSVPWANCKSLEGYEAEEQTEMTEAPDAADTGNFRLSTVNEHLVKSITESGDDILLDHYLGAFREICKIFREMGTVFNFVTSDLEDKIRILEEYRSHNDIAYHFKSLSSMVSYEINSGAIKHSNPPSGSRTLLRLHRALEFVSMFFHRLAVVDFKEKMTSLAQDCYEQTLSKHHGFLVRKGALLAMYALPTVDAMFTKALDDKAEIRSLLTSVGNNAADVANITHKLFQANDLLDLP